ncbi:MAG: EamA family transporter [Acidimicrobiia bacterium]
MSGIFIAIAAGVGFGVFQAINRRVNQEIDAYRSTFLVLSVGSALVIVWTIATQDLALLEEAPPVSYLAFAAAGVLHFFIGWTLLSLSQQRLGAAGTGAILAAIPLIGSLLAAAVLDERLTPVAVLGVVLVTGGIAVISLRRGPGPVRQGVPWFGLATAVSWGSSPLLIRWGLEGLPSPMIGVSIGLLAASLVYAIVLLVTRRRRAAGSIPRDVLRWVLVAGVLVAFAIAMQWIAFDLLTVAIVVTLIQLQVPTVIVTAPWLMGSAGERLSPSLLAGAAAVFSGSVLVVLAGTA